MRRGYDAFNAGDVESTLALVHPEIEWHTYLVPGPGGGTYRGFDGVRELWADVRNIFVDYRNDPEQIIAMGDKVVAFICISGRGLRSGVDVEARIAHVFTFREDKILRVESYADRDEALRAAGSARRANPS